MIIKHTYRPYAHPETSERDSYEYLTELSEVVKAEDEEKVCRELNRKHKGWKGNVYINYHVEKI